VQRIQCDQEIVDVVEKLRRARKQPVNTGPQPPTAARIRASPRTPEARSV
jgi:hypothetical protein